MDALDALVGVWTAAFVVAALLPSDVPILTVGAIGLPLMLLAGLRAGARTTEASR